MLVCGRKREEERREEVVKKRKKSTNKNKKEGPLSSVRAREFIVHARVLVLEGFLKNAHAFYSLHLRIVHNTSQHTRRAWTASTSTWKKSACHIHFGKKRGKVEFEGWDFRASVNTYNF